MPSIPRRLVRPAARALFVVLAFGLASCERNGTTPPEPLVPVAPLGGDSVRTTGQVILPTGATTPLAGMSVISSGGSATASSNGDFSLVRLKTGRPGVIYVGRSNSDVLLLGVAEHDTAAAKVDSASTALALLAMHPALAAADSVTLRALLESARGSARFAALARAAANSARAGTNIFDNSQLWFLADSIVAAMGAGGAEASSAARDPRAFALDSNDPTFSRSGAGTWAISNPRPLYLGLELRRLDGTVQRVMVDAATFEWSLSLEFYRRVPRSTSVALLSTGAFNGSLSRGFSADMGGGFQAQVGATNAAVVVWTALSAFVRAELISKNCLVQAAVDGGLTYGDLLVSHLRRLETDVLELVALGNSTFDIATSCASDNLKGDLKKDWLLANMRSVSQYLKVFNAVDRATSAWQLGQMVASLFDPLHADKFALLDDGTRSGLAVDGGALWVTSAPPGAESRYGTTVIGATPRGQLNVAAGTHQVRFSQTGRASAEVSALVTPGRWTAVHGVLAELDLRLRLSVTSPSSPVQPGNTARFTLRVTDAEGAAVPGASVEVLSTLLGGAPPLTDETGTTTWDATVPSTAAAGNITATFTASKTGTETSTPSIGSVTVELPALQIEVTPSAIVEVMAGESVTYEITVRDGAGATVAGASIAGENAVTGSSVSISPTNEVGRATLVFAVPASRAAGDYIVRLAASKSGYTASSEESRTVRVTPPRLSIAVEPSDTVVRFPSQAVTFTITVRDPSGAPVRDASIAVTDNQENASGTTGPTDANGRATWTSDVAAGRAPATYRVSFVASKTDFLDSHSVSRYVRVVHPKLVLTVTPTSRSTIRRGENVTFTITARDEAGQPVSGAGIGIADELRAGSFTAGPTDGQGRTTYQTTASQSRAFDDYDIRFWASKTAYVTSDTLTRVVRVSPPTGDLGVTLQNIGAVNAPATGSVVMLYTDPIRTIEDANPAVFQGVPAGRYLVEGYFDGTFVGRELWTSRQVDVLADMSQSATLLRNYPYAESVVFKNNATNVVIAEGATIAAGTVVRAEVTVRNNIPNDPRTVRVRVFLDRNRQSSYDFSTFSQSQTVNGSGATVTFSVTFTPTLTGSYSRAIGVYTMLNSEVLTDSWDWRAAFNR